MSRTAVCKKLHLAEKAFNAILVYFKIPKQKRVSNRWLTLNQLLSIYPFATRDWFWKIYKKQHASLPELMVKYGMPYHHTLRFLSHYEITPRSVKEGHRLITRRKLKAYCASHNIKNISQIPAVKNKKRETCLRKYGKDNIFKSKWFKDNVDEFISAKYNLPAKEFRSAKGRLVWARLSEERKREWLLASIGSEKSRQSVEALHLKGFISSKSETLISSALDYLKIPYQTQFKVQATRASRRAFADFRVVDTPILIELYGDYWHASPKRYLPDDLVHYKFAKIKAKDIWEKDEERLDFIRKSGYYPLTVWEWEVKNLSLIQRAEIIYSKLQILCQSLSELNPSVKLPAIACDTILK